MSRTEQEKQRTLEQAVESYQERSIGPDFKGASPSLLQGPAECMEKLNKYMRSPRGFLVYIGCPGIGKTYFCSTLVEWAFKNFSTFRYHREIDVLRRLRESMSERHNDYARELEYLMDDDLIMFDDVGSGINPDRANVTSLEWRVEVFFSFLDYRHRSGKPTVITSNFNRQEIYKIYCKRSYSRLFDTRNTIIELFDETEDKRSWENR